MIFQGDMDTDETTQYIKVPTNRPRELVTMNDALALVIKVGKLIKFQIDTPQDIAFATCVLKDPKDDVLYTYKGQGSSLGEALRAMLDSVNVDYPLSGPDYPEVNP